MHFCRQFCSMHRTDVHTESAWALRRMDKAREKIWWRVVHLAREQGDVDLSAQT